MISGKKTTTIRKGRRRYDVGSALLTSKPGDITIEITEIYYKKFRDLVDQDAVLDGFCDVHELRRVLMGFYRDISDDDTVTIVRFSVK